MGVVQDGCNVMRTGHQPEAPFALNHEPSLASSLKFLRRTPWAREQVEALYLDMLRAVSDRKPFRT